jgi:hypothetical protein
VDHTRNYLNTKQNNLCSCCNALMITLLACKKKKNTMQGDSTLRLDGSHDQRNYKPQVL